MIFFLVPSSFTIALNQGIFVPQPTNSHWATQICVISKCRWHFYCRFSAFSQFFLIFCRFHYFQRRNTIPSMADIFLLPFIDLSAWFILIMLKKYIKFKSGITRIAFITPNIKIIRCLLGIMNLSEMKIDFRVHTYVIAHFILKTQFSLD